MNIRQAQAKDRFALIALLAELDYGGTESVTEARLAHFCRHPDITLLVIEHGQYVVGFLSIHFFPHLALASECARITHFCVAGGEHSQSAEALLLARAELLAHQRGCHRVEIHSHPSRSQALQGYTHKGYQSSSRCLSKDLLSA